VTTGGVARPQSYELTGPLATGVLEQVTLDVAILGVDGIDAAAGCHRAPRGRGQHQPADGPQAAKVVIAADSSKVGRRARSPGSAPPGRSTCWSPTPGSPPKDAARLEDAGVDVVTA